MFVLSTVTLLYVVNAFSSLNLLPVEDIERNDGSPEKPYLMSEDLRKILKKKNKTDPAQ